MKKIFQHPPEPVGARKYWRSLDELADTPEFRGWLEREFPAGAAELETDDLSRRNFIKLMGASTALAGLGLAGCRRPEKHLVPFNKGAEWAIPGKALFYATSMPHRRGAIPLIVATHDGRPTKIEGNPLHPASNGGTDVFAQASVLDLYDPDRSRFFIREGKQSDEAAFDARLQELRAAFSASGGEGLAFLVEETNSPSRELLRAEIERAFPKAGWYSYEPLGSGAAGEATRAAFGDGVKVLPKIAKADVILSLDCDFLGCGEGSVENARAFASRRRLAGPEDTMNRLYVVENRYTVTGGMADHRMRAPASHISEFALTLAARIAVTTNDSALKRLCVTFPKPQGEVNFTPDWIEELAKDLVSARGRSLVLVGERQPAAVHLIAYAINWALGNLGVTLVGQETTEKPSSSIAELKRAIDGHLVKTLFIFGGNPAYNAPADLDWAAAQKSVAEVIRLGLHEDETSQLAKWQVPAAHYLETWGDARCADGSYVSVQPMILPLYGGWSETDILMRLLGLPKPQGPELVQETFRQVVRPADFETEWNRFLHDGFTAKAAPAARVLAFNSSVSAGTLGGAPKAPLVAGRGQLELVLIADPKVDDGRYANNGWMQELPDPTTKLTWDNAALVSPLTAKHLGLKSVVENDPPAQVLEISMGNHSIEIPVLIAPGHADDSISIALGYGRAFAGRVCKGVGVNAYPLMTTAHPYFAVGAKVTATAKTYPLAITQHHHSMEGRGIVREATLDQYRKEPDFAQKVGMDAEKPPGGYPSMYVHPPLKDANQWGMVVDLNTCTGCSACVVACQAENNIPIVGKEQVINGRAMHWIRSDRYFASVDEKEADPEMVMQPMMCQHCENAPCETVCPVNATVHSEDGLNVMAYNRCIGTRYCANNCPFKVRRFNFFDYNQRPIQGEQLYLGPLTKKGSPDSIKMQKNPNVTVRMRGVMEKCTFCVQRIQEARIASKVKVGGAAYERIPADTFKTACQQACPAEAIVFGDIANPESNVSKLRKQQEGGRSYRLLDYLNIGSRINYLARVRNPNMNMPGAKNIGSPGGHEPRHANHGGEA